MKMQFFNIFRSTTLFHHSLMQCNSINGLPKFVMFYSKSSDKLQEVLKSIPEKPKKPVSTYFRFIKLAEPQIQQEYPNATRKEIIKAASVLWQNVDADTMSRLKNEYSREMELYKNAFTAYQSCLTEEQIIALELNKVDKKKKKQKSELKKKRRELEMPKRPLNAYGLFVSANRPTSDMKAKDVMIKMAAEWKKLSPEEKEKYNKLYSKNKAKYADDMAEWETKMIELGHSDLLRSSKSISKSNDNHDNTSKKRNSKIDSTSDDIKFTEAPVGDVSDELNHSSRKTAEISSNDKIERVVKSDPSILNKTLFLIKTVILKYNFQIIGVTLLVFVLLPLCYYLC